MRSGHVGRIAETMRGLPRRRATFRCAAPLVLVVAGACSDRSSSPPRPALVVGGPGISPGRFRQPRAVAVERESGRFYVVDRSGRIQRFAPTGEVLGVWELPESARGQPVGLAVERGGTLLVNDSHYSRILRYSADGSELLDSWGAEGTGEGEFTFGRDVVVDSRGCIYAGDYGGMNDRIQKFTPEGRFVLQWGSRGTGPGQFQRPQGMAVEASDGGERILVADCANHRVQRFTTDGRHLSTIGRLGQGPGELRFPISVAVDATGHILVVEWGNNRVQRFDPDGRSVGVWGRAGRSPGELATPWDLAIGADGRIHVVDYGNHRVQIFRWPESAALAGGSSWPDGDGSAEAGS